jgi:hypothetical protein
VWKHQLSIYFIVHNEVFSLFWELAVSAGTKQIQCDPTLNNSSRGTFGYSVCNL